VRFCFGLFLFVLPWLPTAAATSPLRFSGWISPEVESAHITRGRIKVLDPVWNLDSGLRAETESVGYVIVGLWTESDLTGRYTGTRRPFFSELDPLLSYGYELQVAEEWSLDSRLGLQWNWMEGYREDGRKSYDEWQWRETLKTPWVNLYVLTRTFYHPYYAMAFKCGIKRSFRFCERFSFDPNVWVDGGSERWNRQRFGAHSELDPAYHAGPNSISAQIILSYWLSDELRLFGGLTEYVAVGGVVREQISANPARTALLDLMVFSIGLTWSL